MGTIKKESAGILLYRFAPSGWPEVLLAHMGGPYWAKKDNGSWTIPKGEVGEGEDRLNAARREFEEETGTALRGPFRALLPIKQKGGKVVHAWAVEGELDPTQLRSNLFELEWPPRSGKFRQYPEIDRAAWFSMDEARKKILPGQVELLDQLLSFCPGLFPGP